MGKMSFKEMDHAVRSHIEGLEKNRLLVKCVPGSSPQQDVSGLRPNWENK